MEAFPKVIENLASERRVLGAFVLVVQTSKEGGIEWDFVWLFCHTTQRSKGTPSTSQRHIPKVKCLRYVGDDERFDISDVLFELGDFLRALC